MMNTFVSNYDRAIFSKTIHNRDRITVVCTDLTLVWPHSCSAFFSSSCSRSITLLTPSSPPMAKPHSMGRPINTPRAPSARARSTSLPRRTPPSAYTCEAGSQNPFFILKARARKTCQNIRKIYDKHRKHIEMYGRTIRTTIDNPL